MEGLDFSNLAEAGAIGVAMVALALCAYTIKVLTNHLAHVAEILGNISASVQALVYRLLDDAAERDRLHK